MAEGAQRAETFKREQRLISAANRGGDVNGAGGGFTRGMLSRWWNAFARRRLDSCAIPDGPDLALETLQFKSACDGELAFVLRAIEFSKHRRAGGGNRGDDRLAGNLKAGFEDGLFGRCGHQAIVEDQLNGAFFENLFGEQSQRLSHLLQNSAAGMNQHGTDLFLAEPDVVLLYATNEVVELGEHFNARESAAAHDEGEKLAAHLGILLDIRLFEHMNDVIAERHCVGQGAERHRVFEHAG